VEQPRRAYHSIISDLDKLTMMAANVKTDPGAGAASEAMPSANCPTQLIIERCHK